jgi:hypothetical protein
VVGKDLCAGVERSFPGGCRADAGQVVDTPPATPMPSVRRWAVGRSAAGPTRVHERRGGGEAQLDVVSTPLATPCRLRDAGGWLKCGGVLLIMKARPPDPIVIVTRAGCKCGGWFFCAHSMMGTASKLSPVHISMALAQGSSAGVRKGFERKSAHDSRGKTHPALACSVVVVVFVITLT